MSDLIEFDDEATNPSSAPEFLESDSSDTPPGQEFDDDGPTGEVGPPPDVEPDPQA